MYKKVSALIGLCLLSFQSFSQLKTEEIIGYYLSPEKNSIFKFYKHNEKYYGKIVWMKRPERLDSLNPDKTKRKEKILGSIVVNHFIYDGKHTWHNGMIYNANTGKSYKAKITRDKKQNLLVRGYIGVQLIGKSEYFVKVDFKE